MKVINRLKRPGEIRSVRLDPEIVTIRTVDNKMIFYRRVEDGDVSVQDVSVRRGTLPTKL